MWVLVAGCYSDKVDLTGGGEVGVALVGDHLTEAAFTVDGMSEEELDDLFANGHHPPDVFARLDAWRLTPDYAAAEHLGYAKREETYVSLGDNDVDGFTPCGVQIRHVELYLQVEPAVAMIQFDSRVPDDPSVASGGLAPDTIVGTVDAEHMTTDVVFDDLDVDELTGVGTAPVSVLCPDGVSPATLSLTWEFDPKVHRRAHQRGWSGPYGGY